MLDQIEFILSEAFVSLRRNSWMTFAAVTTSAMALFLIGGIGIIYISLANLAASIESKFEMRVLVKDGPSADELASLKTKLQALEGVNQVTFKDRDTVWQEFQRDNPKVVEDMAGDIENPLPDTYIVTFKDLKAADKIADQIRKFPEVAAKNPVNYLAEEQDLLEKAMGSLRWLGLVLGGLMLTTGGILIYNTIRLTIVARRREIRIMELVGATKNMVVTPLLIEGATQGALGAALATAGLAVAYVVSGHLVSAFNPLHEPSPFPAQSVIIVLGLIGLIYGLVCSVLAIREPKQKELPR